jgi:peptidoglycan/xylan/chitin deacetylase (PgdA/CDA1 family)
MTSRRLLVRLLGSPAATLALLVLRLGRRRVGVVLLYHSIALRGGDPATEIVPPHSTQLLERQLRHVRRHYRTVAADEILTAVATRRRGARFPVAVTFDDDLASHVEEALPVLVRTGTPATFFLSGASLGEPHEFWWERVQRAYSRESAPAQPISELAAGLLHTPAPLRDRAVAELEPGPTPPDAGMPVEHVRQLALAGLGIGFHTLGHEPLTQLDDDQLSAALRDGREALAEVAGGPLTTIAYPHGRVDGRVREAACAADFATGFSAAGRAATSDDDPLMIPRIVPSHRSPGHFALQLVLELLGR